MLESWDRQRPRGPKLGGNDDGVEQYRAAVIIAMRIRNTDMD